MFANKAINAWVSNDREAYYTLVSRMPFEENVDNVMVESDESVLILALFQTVEASAQTLDVSSPL